MAPSDRPAWEDVYPELVNKIRWAISTSFSMKGSSYPYSASQKLATVLSQDAIEMVKLGYESPSLLNKTGNIRSALDQVRADRTRQSLTDPV